MPPDSAIADPERALAVAYAPRDKQAALATLFELDERLGQIVSSTTEPMIGLMRLTWWREALEKLDRDPAPGEPLLQAVVANVIAHGVTGKALAAIEDGWSALIDAEDDASLIERHGTERGRNLFAVAATLLAAEDHRLPAAGEVWALVDLAFHHSRNEIREGACTRASELANRLPPTAWPRASRPLAALFALALRDSRGETRIQGSPGRLLRMLALSLTGR